MNPFDAPEELDDGPTGDVDADGLGIRVTVDAEDYYQSWRIAFGRRMMVIGFMMKAVGIVILALAVLGDEGTDHLMLSGGLVLILFPIFLRFNIRRSYVSQIDQLPDDDLELHFSFDPDGVLSVENGSSIIRMRAGSFLSIKDHPDYLLLFKTSRYYHLIPLHRFPEAWRKRVRSYFGFDT